MVTESVGVIFKHYPSVTEIAAAVPVTLDEAQWMFCACWFEPPSLRLILINDMARAVLAGCPLTNSTWQRAAIISMLVPPMWQRVKGTRR